LKLTLIHAINKVEDIDVEVERDINGLLLELDWSLGPA
jgi:hypothetical protein